MLSRSFHGLSRGMALLFLLLTVVANELAYRGLVFFFSSRAGAAGSAATMAPVSDLTHFVMRVF